MKITFITHSSFLVELESSVLIFDYFKGTLPEFDPGKEIYFFASHKHGDHYDPMIFQYADRWEHVSYILSKEIRTKGIARGEKQSEQIFSLGKDQDLEVGALKIHTLRSTDLGVAFLIETEGKRIYHAGDLNWWHWEGEDKGWNYQMEQNYKKELAKIAGQSFDVAFVPLDPRLGHAFDWGMKTFMEVTHTKLVYPMHFWGDFTVCRQLKADPQAADFADRVVDIQKENQQWRY
ncbi:MAG: MBL fold metallo-hydrolase [Lachnospiraceae bacterium]|jgi:L-ascorbate metabolism protein UlaG (beta-lactamase superfamily)|nr:MBL fold metallo-hydrolase [Lachnospiraceae bacterium]